MLRSTNSASQHADYLAFFRALLGTCTGLLELGKVTSGSALDSLAQAIEERTAAGLPLPPLAKLTIDTGYTCTRPKIATLTIIAEAFSDTLETFPDDKVLEIARERRKER